MAKRTEEQPFTYQQLRDEISNLIGIGDKQAILEYVTAENQEIIRNCDAGLLGAESQTNAKSLLAINQARLNMKAAFDAVATVDDAIALFTSTNILLSQLDVQIDSDPLSLYSYLELLDEEALAKNDSVC